MAERSAIFNQKDRRIDRRLTGALAGPADPLIPWALGPDPLKFDALVRNSTSIWPWQQQNGLLASSPPGWYRT